MKYREIWGLTPSNGYYRRRLDMPHMPSTDYILLVYIDIVRVQWYWRSEQHIDRGVEWLRLAGRTLLKKTYVISFQSSFGPNCHGG
jgi:hypothetical protein